MSKKIAYLLLAHDYIDNIDRIIKKLNFSNAFFYIHIDKKVDISPYLKRLNASNIFFITDRIDVQWGGYSQNKAVLNLFKLAYLNNNDYYILLSGHDYPLFKGNEIFDKINILENYYSIWVLNALKELKGRAKNRYTKYHFNDLPILNPQHKLKNRALNKIFKGVYYSQRIFFYLLPDRKFTSQFVLCKGSTWMGLTKDAVEKIFNWMNDKKNKKIINYLKFCSSSDEVLFHSILYNNNILPKNISDNKNTLGLHYIKWDWEKEKKPNVLTENDYYSIKNSGCLFIRKIDAKKSDGLIEVLEK